MKTVFLIVIMIALVCGAVLAQFRARQAAHQTELARAAGQRASAAHH
jgi:hypothetical protein